MLIAMDNNGVLAAAAATVPPQPSVKVSVSAPKVLEKGKNPLVTILVVVAVIFLFFGAAGFGLWKIIDRGKKEIKTIAQQQTEQLNSLGQNLEQVVSMYKNSDSKSTGDNTNAVVLGESVVRDDSGQVLGLEDDPTVVRERTLMGKLQDGQTTLTNIRKNDTDINSHNSSMIAMFLAKNNPVVKTETFVTNIDGIYGYFLKSADRDIRSTALGFNLGVALQMALATPDEPSIQRLQNVITDFQNMVTEEKNTDTTALPPELTAFHTNIVKADEGMIATVANLPTLFRQKDLQGIKDSLKSFLTSAVMSGATGQVDLVSFWQGNATVRSLPDLQKAWQDYAAKL
jgi:hypothetical protein